MVCKSRAHSARTRCRFCHLVIDAIDRLPQTGSKGAYLKQQLQDKLIEHKQFISTHGEDLPEIRNWKWTNPN